MVATSQDVVRADAREVTFYVIDRAILIESLILAQDERWRRG